ncbi:hypothetical protein PG984_013378 [Apiospora sp. TS-2023a]
MAKTNSTTLSDKDLKIMAVFLREFRKKNKNMAGYVDWKPYHDVLGFKGDRAAKDAFEYTCLKFANIEKAMGSGPSTPNGKSGDATTASSAPKKATSARAQPKRKRTANRAEFDDLNLVKDEDESDDAPLKKRARVSDADEENDDILDEI